MERSNEYCGWVSPFAARRPDDETTNMTGICWYRQQTALPDALWPALLEPCSCKIAPIENMSFFHCQSK